MKEIDLEKLIGYLSGSLNQAERIQVENWIAQSDDNKKSFEQLKQIWNSPTQEFPKPNTEAALQKVLSRINTSEKIAGTITRAEDKKEESVISKLYHSNLFRAAAVILIILSSLFLIKRSTTNYQPETILAKINKVEIVTLSDGTKITLDAGSTLSYPKTFTGKNRQVYLKGEAYFEVAPDKDSPFVVNASNGLVTVLGTKFNVRAWKNNNVIVAVAEGRVSLKNPKDENGDEAIVTKGKMSTLIENGNITKPVDVDISKYISWIKREIYFTNVTCKEVLDQLERWYNIKFQIADQSILSNNLTVFIANKPLKENLEVITAVLNVSYKIEAGKVVLYKK